MAMRTRADGLSEYVTRREMEDRLAQMDMRISLLANALRQQDELTHRMQATLEDVVARTAALPQPRPARSALSARRQLRVRKAAAAASAAVFSGRARPSSGRMSCGYSSATA